jgi:hypothetical protein
MSKDTNARLVGLLGTMLELVRVTLALARAVEISKKGSGNKIFHKISNMTRKNILFQIKLAVGQVGHSGLTPT